MRIVDLPLYYRESFFSQSPYYHPEMPAGRPGVAGDPVPYTIASDDLLTSLLLGCFILGCVAFAQSRDFIFRQVKHFFRVRNEGTSEIAETTGEIRFQIFLALQTSLLYAILFFLYLRHLRVETFIAEQFVVIGILTGLVAAYFLLKAFAQWLVGWVFFGKRKNNQWLKILSLPCFFARRVAFAAGYAASLLPAHHQEQYYLCGHRAWGNQNTVAL